MTESPYVHFPNEGRVLDMGPFAMTVKADAQQTGGAFTLLEADEPPGFGPPLHIHEVEAEAFYVLAGEYVIFIRDEEHRCSTGSFVYIPAGVEHTFRVGSQRSRKLNLYLPAGMTGYFEELATATAAGTKLGDDELAALGARYGVRVLGPVPEGYV